MAKFLAIHPLPFPVTIKDANLFGRKAKANVTVDAYWVKSWAQLNEEGKIVKLFCEWNATDIDAVRKVMAKMPELPCEGVYPLMIVDSEDFR
ncbi:MAG: hypothetical protein QXI36_01025 [Candidatus Bathyarchaeia archaeon]